MSRWNTIAQIQRENGFSDCEMEDSAGRKDKGCSGNFEESHHGIFAGQKFETRVQWRRFLDHPINHTRSCHSCNVSRVADPEAARDLRFVHQRIVYGVAPTKAWLKSAPDEIKGRPEFIRYWKAVSE